MLDAFEVGQLYVALGTKGIERLSPELRRKLKSDWEASRSGTVDIKPVIVERDAYHYATDEPLGTDTL